MLRWSQTFDSMRTTENTFIYSGHGRRLFWAYCSQVTSVKKSWYSQKLCHIWTVYQLSTGNLCPHSLISFAKKSPTGLPLLMREHFDVVRTMRQKHHDKMKLQRWNLQYYRHTGGKISKKVRHSTDFHIPYSNIPSASSGLLSNSLCKAPFPQWLFAVQGVEKKIPQEP